MTYYKKSLVAGAICALACSNLLAQEAEFDLSSQRLEIQQVLPVPGKKIDHQGIIINPTPHRLTVDRNNMLDMTSGLVLKDKQDKFSQDLMHKADVPDSLAPTRGVDCLTSRRAAQDSS